MKAEDLMKLDPTLSPEDAIYYERSEMKTPYEIEQIERELSHVKRKIRTILDIKDYIYDRDEDWLDTLDDLREELSRQEQRLQIKLKVTREWNKNYGIIQSS